MNEIKNPRDKIILRILFLCAVRRGELLVLKWKDFYEKNGMYILNIERSFCSQTRKVKDWTKDQASERKTPGKVAVPPQLAKDIMGWREFGDTDGSDPESYIFPTRNATCIIPTNWSDDVLKPTGAKVGIPNVSFHWFRRGHATVQHHSEVVDKQIQGQLRHSKVETTRNIYMQQVDKETWSAVVDLEKVVESQRATKRGGKAKRA